MLTLLKVVFYLAFTNVARCMLLENIGPMYNVRYHHARIPKAVANKFANNEVKNSYGDTFEILKIGKDGESKEYLCSLPSERYLYNQDSDLNHNKIEYDLNNTTNNEVKSHDGNSSNKSSLAESLAQRAVSEVQKSFSNEHCVFAYDLNGGYWTYAYCFGDKVIQYHEGSPVYLRTKIHNPVFPDYVYVLGRQLDISSKHVNITNQANGTDFQLTLDDFTIDDDTHSPFTSVVSKRQPTTQKIIKHKIGSGEMCDLTNEPRSVEVIYKCDPINNRGIPEIVTVHEVTTCQYQMVVNTPRLCLIDEFIPNHNIEEKAIDIDCKLISNEEGEVKFENEKNIEFFDFYKFLDEAPVLDSSFPIHNDYKISIVDYNLAPLGNGFYFGHIKDEPKTSNVYFNSRHVIIYNAFYDSINDLVQNVGKVFGKGIERILMAPIFEGEKDEQRTLHWNDTFTVWFEIYDFNGNFISLSKISRNGKLETRTLHVQLIDPDTMLDQDGDYVSPMVFEPSSYQAPNGAWNFEEFISYKDSAEYKEHMEKLSQKQQDEINTNGIESETETIIHTVTVTAEKEDTHTVHGEESVTVYIQDTVTVYGEATGEVEQTTSGEEIEEIHDEL